MITFHNVWGRSLIAGAVAALVLGCASAPTPPAGSEQVRAKLRTLQNDPSLAPLAPMVIKDAEAAVTQAEIKQPDLELAAYRVYIADRKVETARAMAETRAAENARTGLSEQADKARLNSRTREADRAKSDAMMARAETAEQKMLSDQKTAELQRQLELMQARPTDRGLVLTLGDTLFDTGKSEIKSGATANLDRLSVFLIEYKDRTAVIEGFTDSMGSEQYNQELSQRRADSVKRYLVGQGVGSSRLSSDGRGENSPVADNESAAGRQQNRRVEVVISEVSAGSGSN